MCFFFIPIAAPPLINSIASQRLIPLPLPVCGFFCSLLGLSAVELSALISLESFFGLSGFELSFLSSLGVSFSLSVIVSAFCISFVPSLSPKYLPHSSQYQYSIFPSLSRVASTLSICVSFPLLFGSISPYSLPQISQVAFFVQVALPPECVHLYPHSVHSPAFHSWGYLSIVTSPQQSYFFSCSLLSNFQTGLPV